MSHSPARKTPRRVIPFPGGAAIFRRMFARLGCRGRAPHFNVAFYPYASLSHTIRLRGEEADARLSDLMRGAPLEALEAAAAILLSKLYRLRLPAPIEAGYRRFAESARVSRRIARARRHRGRRKHTGPHGHAHDLAGIYQRMNAEYFSDRLPATDLGWSTQAWRRQLGVFDPGMCHIVINRRLDREQVPEHVVAYVVYHEMLHLERDSPATFDRAADRLAGEDRCHLGLHTPEFRRAERRFREYERARRFLLRAGLW
ncbi:MAG TPA: hypothetical protein VJW51_11055 [Candidatus Acidoferrales bacterium]|nr:hypothetical protein [Candidatus Acidoferrales bacterium]